MKKTFKNAIIFMTCAMVSGASLFANTAKSHKVEVITSAEYFPLLGVTVVETKDAEGNISVQFREGNHENLVKHEKTSNGIGHGVNCKVKDCEKCSKGPDHKPQSHKSENKPGKTDNKAEIKVDIKPIITPNAKPQPKPQPKPDVVKPEHKHKSKPQAHKPHDKREHNKNQNYHKSEHKKNNQNYHKSEPKKNNGNKGPAYHKSEPRR